MTNVDCRRFEDQLDAFEAATLPAAEMAAAGRHLSVCPSCSRLHRAVSGDVAAPALESGADIVNSVLRRTTGEACPAARSRLCAWVDGELEAGDGVILELHLAHCPECSALANSLAELKKVLPGLAAIEPDARFVEDVLLSTSRGTGDMPVAQAPGRLAGWWQGLLRRPRFSLETAYVGALLLLLALGNPSVLSRFTPDALDLPQALLQRGDRILEKTSSALARRQDDMQRSFAGIRNEGRALLQAASGLPTRAATAIRENGSAFLEELRLSLFPEEIAGPQERDRR